MGGASANPERAVDPSRLDLRIGKIVSAKKVSTYVQLVENQRHFNFFFHFCWPLSSLTVPQPRTDYFNKSFSYSGAQFGNSLPIELRQVTSLNDFKTKLRCHSYK